MQTKPLYILISNGGDGSYSTNYTLDPALIQKLREAYDNDLMDYDDVGCDGDGFHYDTINVPFDATYESLGISYPMDESHFGFLSNEEEEEEG